MSNITQAIMLMYGSYHHLIAISQNKSDRVAHIIARTKRMMIILGFSAFSLMLAGVCYIILQFAVVVNDRTTAITAGECTLFASSFLAIYVICTAFAFEDLIQNHLGTTESRSTTRNVKAPKSIVAQNSLSQSMIGAAPRDSNLSYAQSNGKS